MSLDDGKPLLQRIREAKAQRIMGTYKGNWLEHDAYLKQIAQQVAEGKVAVKPIENNEQYRTPLATWTQIGTEIHEQIARQIAEGKGTVKSIEKTCVVCGRDIKHKKTIVDLCSAECAAASAIFYRTGKGFFLRMKEPADRALRFLAGLNLQDHSKREQTEARDIVHALLELLKPERYGK